MVFFPRFGAWLVALTLGQMFDFTESVKCSVECSKHMATLKLPNRGLAEASVIKIMIVKLNNEQNI